MWTLPPLRLHAGAALAEALEAKQAEAARADAADAKAEHLQLQLAETKATVRRLQADNVCCRANAVLTCRSHQRSLRRALPTQEALNTRLLGASQAAAASSRVQFLQDSAERLERQLAMERAAHGELAAESSRLSKAAHGAREECLALHSRVMALQAELAALKEGDAAVAGSSEVQAARSALVDVPVMPSALLEGGFGPPPPAADPDAPLHHLAAGVVEQLNFVLGAFLVLHGRLEAGGQAASGTSAFAAPTPSASTLASPHIHVSPASAHSQRGPAGAGSVNVSLVEHVRSLREALLQSQARQESPAAGARLSVRPKVVALLKAAYDRADRSSGELEEEEAGQAAIPEGTLLLSPGQFEGLVVETAERADELEAQLVDMERALAEAETAEGDARQDARRAKLAAENAAARAAAAERQLDALRNAAQGLAESLAENKASHAAREAELVDSLAVTQAELQAARSAASQSQLTSPSHSHGRRTTHAGEGDQTQELMTAVTRSDADSTVAEEALTQANARIMTLSAELSAARAVSSEVSRQAAEAVKKASTADAQVAALRSKCSSLNGKLKRMQSGMRRLRDESAAAAAAASPVPAARAKAAPPTPSEGETRLDASGISTWDSATGGGMPRHSPPRHAAVASEAVLQAARSAEAHAVASTGDSVTDLLASNRQLLGALNVVKADFASLLQAVRVTSETRSNAAEGQGSKSLAATHIAQSLAALPGPPPPARAPPTPTVRPVKPIASPHASQPPSAPPAPPSAMPQVPHAHSGVRRPKRPSAGFTPAPVATPVSTPMPGTQAARVSPLLTGQS